MSARSDDDAAFGDLVDPLAPFSATAAELKQLLETERAGLPFLALRDESRRLVLHVLRGSERARTIGRRPGCTLAIVWDPEVSGVHAELEEISGIWTLVDNGLSINGTFVNGQRIVGRRRLAGGDRIRVGRTVIAFTTVESLPLAKTVAAGQDHDAQAMTAAQKRVLVALCRPYFSTNAGFTAPATNQQIADELFITVDAVKLALRGLFVGFKLHDLPQNQKRAKLAETALRFGLVSPSDLQG